MGFTGLALGEMLLRDGIVRAGGVPAPAAAHGQRALCAQGQERDLDLPGRRHEPPGNVRSQAGLERICRPGNRRNTAQGRADRFVRTREPARGRAQRCQRAHPAQAVSAASRPFRSRGQSGLEISDWWPHLGACVDDLAIVRSMWTTDNNHGAQLQFHTGRHVLEGQFPTIGSWVHYGLGSLNDNLPQFVVLGTPIADCCGGIGAHGANYLGPEHSGVQLGVDPKNPLPFAAPGHRRLPRGTAGRVRAARAAEPAGGRRVSGRRRDAGPHQVVRAGLSHAGRRARTWSTARPRPRPRARSTASTARRPKHSGGNCLAARRLVEQGVRFVQIFHGSNGGAGAWDAHGNLKNNHQNLCGQVDQPIAALVKDLKQRGMLDETLVVWAPSSAARPARRAPTAATTIRSASRCGWPAADSRGASSTAPPTSWASTPSRTATTSPTSTPPCCTAGHRPPAAGSARPQAVGDRLRPADPRDHRLTPRTAGLAVVHVEIRRALGACKQQPRLRHAHQQRGEQIRPDARADRQHQLQAQLPARAAGIHGVRPLGAGDHSASSCRLRPRSCRLSPAARARRTVRRPGRASPSTARLERWRPPLSRLPAPTRPAAKRASSSAPD